MVKRSSVSGRFATFDAFFAPEDERSSSPIAERASRSGREEIAFGSWSVGSSFREHDADLTELASNVLLNASSRESFGASAWESESDLIWETEEEPEPQLEDRETFFFISHGRLHRVVVWPASEWESVQVQNRGRHVEAFETSRGNYATVHAI